MDPRLVLAISAMATVAFVLIDARDRRFRSSWSHDRPRLKRNVAFLISNLATMFALNLVTHAITSRVPHLIEWQNAGVVVEVVACLVVAEFVNWVSHWIKHQQPWLWTFHAPHHVESHYSVNLTLHTHGLEVIASGALMCTALALLGFSQLALDVFTLSYYVANLYKHCTARLSLGPLDYVLVSPAYHRLHHAVGHDGNFGSVLTLFDVVFRTARFPTTRSEIDDAFAREYGTGDAKDAFGFVDEIMRPMRGVTSTQPSSSSPT